LRSVSPISIFRVVENVFKSSISTHCKNLKSSFNGAVAVHSSPIPTTADINGPEIGSKSPC